MPLLGRAVEGRRRGSRRGRRGTRRRWTAGAVGVLVLVLAWGGYQAARGGRDLQAAEDQLRLARQDLSDTSRAVDRLRQAGRLTGTARGHLHDPVVRGLAALPLVGRPLVAAAGLADAADTTVRGALLPLVEQAGDDPQASLIRGPGTVDLGYLSGLAPVARQSATALQRAAQQLAATPVASGVEPVDRARAAFAGELEQLRAGVDDLALALDLAPGLLGREGTQRYLVLSQSPAEARGTGGLLGGYSLLEATDGALRIVRSGSKTDLQSPGEPVVDLGVQFDDHYGPNGATRGWINSNLSPHFPYAAQISTALWERQYPEPLDGVVMLDPVALSYVLRATGPVAVPDGPTVTTDNVIDETMRDVYARFPDDDARRDAALQAISTGVAAALTTRPVDGRALLSALGQSVSERRLLFWSADEAVQARLQGQTLSGTLPRGRAVGDVIVDTAGSKLDYYLDRDLRYAAGCGRPSRLGLTLTNRAPASGLPDYVTPKVLRNGQPAGTNSVLATLYLPPGSRVTAMTLGGAPVGYRQGTELELEWVEALVVLRPGQSTELAATFDEPLGTDGPLARLAQPLVRPETFTATGC